MCSFKRLTNIKSLKLSRIKDEYFKMNFGVAACIKLNFILFLGSQISLAHSKQRSVSRLYLKQVNQADRGNYTCQPLGLPTAHVTLHVIEPVEEQRLSVTSSAAGLNQHNSFFAREFSGAMFVFLATCRALQAFSKNTII